MKQMQKIDFFAQDFLENGGNLKDVPKNNKHYKKIEELEKVKTVVKMKYKIDESDINWKIVYNFLKKDNNMEKINLDSDDLYDVLHKYKLNQLINLLQRCK